MDALRRFSVDLRNRRVLIPASRLGAGLAHAPGVRSVALLPAAGRLRVDATLDDGEPLQVSITPSAIRFAPRGAKEIVFQIAPADRAGHRGVADLVSALAGLIAHDLYRPALGGPEPLDPSGAILDREGADRLRVDLRTVPAVRAARGSAAMTILVEVMQVQSLRVEPDGLRLEIALPHIPM